MKRRGRIMSVGFVALAALLAAGCGGDDRKVVDAEDAVGSETTMPSIVDVPVEFRPVLAVGGPESATSCGVESERADPGTAWPPGATLITQCEDGQPLAVYAVGPVLLDGSALEDASAGLGQSGQWIVNPTFREGVDGIDRFNAAAAICSAKTPECTRGQLAVVVDGELISAPSIDQASFERDQIQISGSFTEESARALALTLRAAAAVAAVNGD